MRPRLYAAEIAREGHLVESATGRFNEAAALCRGNLEISGGEFKKESLLQ